MTEEEGSIIQRRCTHCSQWTASLAILCSNCRTTCDEALRLLRKRGCEFGGGTWLDCRSPGKPCPTCEFLSRPEIPA